MYCRERRAWGYRCCGTLEVDGRCPLARIPKAVASAGIAKPQKDKNRVAEEYAAPPSEKATGARFVKHALLHCLYLWQEADASAIPDLPPHAFAKTLHAARTLIGGAQLCAEGEVEKLQRVCSAMLDRDYAAANKAYIDLTLGSKTWQSSVPQLVDGNRDGPSVVARVSERLNKEQEKNLSLLDDPAMKDSLPYLKRLMTSMQCLRPNADVSRHIG